MSKCILFYVTGHGFGHAVRSTAVMREILARLPDLRLIVRSAAPRWLFPGTAEYHSVSIDSGVVEHSPTRIDEAASIAALRALLGRSHEIVAAERAFVREAKPDLIVSDMPFLAGEIAHPIPCYALGNFTWDWIYEPLLEGSSELDRIREAYSAIPIALRLPFSHSEGWESFGQVIDVPLITQRTSRMPEETLAAIGLKNETRKIVVLAARGDVSAAVTQAAAQLNEFCFLHTLPEGITSGNVHFVPTTGDLSFADLVAASDAVITKLGYAISAACAALGKPLVYPPRIGFREEEILVCELPKVIVTQPIPTEDFEAGNWAAYIRQACSATKPASRVNAGGASVCAELLCKALST